MFCLFVRTGNDTRVTCDVLILCFGQIHYHRIGKDGFFSHKEITVLFVPNLSNCLPSVDIWRTQWLAYKKDIAEREQPLSLKQEKVCLVANL